MHPSALCAAQGRGPWEFASPESQGLSEEALRVAEERANDEMGDDRLCYMVIKNGLVVYEHYRKGHTPSSLNAAFSTTKSLCASLYGVAVHQGWADPAELVRDRNEGTRQCNADTSFRHVLTMTGQSEDLSNPSFSYDASGLACLDTLADFIDQNNPCAVCPSPASSTTG